MTRIGASATVIAALLLAPPAAWANREQQQIMAEVRMLQQTQQQMQQMVLALAEALKAVTAQLDEQTAANRKALADQRVLIEGMTDTVRVLRERSDDTNVRLSSLAQELESIRMTIAAIPQSMGPPAGVPADPAAGDGSFFPSGSTGPVAPPPGVSPQRTFDTAYADYAAGQYDLAIEGFETFLRFFPRHGDADNAQVYIGNAHYHAGRFKEAIAAYQRVITDYSGTDRVPEAYFKLGSTYLQLKQPDLARKAWQTILNDYDESVTEYMLARQAIERLK